MQRKAKRITIAAGAAALAAGAGIGIATAAGAVGGDSNGPITGAAYEKARVAAIAETGGGRVTGTEVGDEESYYEVEVTLDSGKQVDVQLDKSFHVVSSSTDHEEKGGDSGD